MKKLTIFAIVLLMVGMFSTCKEVEPTVIPVNEDNLSDGTISFTLSVQVIPSSEKGARVAGLDSAEVTINQSGNISKQIVGPDGIAVFSGLSETGAGANAGVSIYISKSGYASVNTFTTLTRTINLDGTGGAGSGSDANHVQFEQVIVTLPKLGASLTGTIYGDFNNDGNTRVDEFAVVNVRVLFTNTIQPNLYETTTSATNGSFTLSNLPETVGTGNPSTGANAPTVTISYDDNSGGMYSNIPFVAPGLIAGSTVDFNKGISLLIARTSSVQNVTLKGTVYGDFNSDGFALIDENAAVTVKVSISNGDYETTTSATNGSFTLSGLPEGMPTSITLSYDDGSGGIYGPTGVAPVALASGGTFDLGSNEIIRSSPVQNMTLTGTIYGDFNNDGNTEVTEHAAVNVRISFGSVVYVINTSATTGIFTLNNFSETTITDITTDYDDGSGGIYGGTVAGFPVTLNLGETLDLGQIEAPRTSPVNPIKISGWIYGNWSRDTIDPCSPCNGINTCVAVGQNCLASDQGNTNQYKNGKKIKLTYISVVNSPADDDVVGDVYYTTTATFNSKNGHFEFTDLPAIGTVSLEIDFDPVLLISGGTGSDDTYYDFEFPGTPLIYNVSYTEKYIGYKAVNNTTLTKP